MARELNIVITADGRQAIDTFRQVDRAVSQSEQTTRKAATAQSGLLDAYGRSVKPTQDFAGAQEQVNTKKKAAVSVTEQLSGAMLKYISGAVLLAAIDRTLKYASNLEKLVVDLKSTTRGVQELENIAVRSNTTVDNLAQAIFQMDQRLLSGDKGAVKALKELRIGFDAFIRLPAEQKLYTLNTALKGIEDQTDRDRLAGELFGRSLREVYGALNGDVDDLKTGIHTMSDQTVKDLAVAERSWGSLLLAARRYFGEVLAMAVPRGASPWLQAAGSRVGAVAEAAGWTSGALPTLPAAPASTLPIGAGPIAPRDMTADTLRRTEANMRQASIFGGIQTQDAGNVINPRFSPSAWDAWMNTQGRGFQEGPLGTFNAANFGTPVGENFLTSRSLTNGLGVGPASIAGMSGSRPSAFGGRAGIAQGVMGGIGAMAGGGSLTSGLMSTAMSTGTGLASAALAPGAMAAGTLAAGAATMGIGAAAMGAYAGIRTLMNRRKIANEVNKPQQAFFEQQGGLETLNPKLQLATGSVQLAQNLFDAKTKEQNEAAMKAITVALDDYIARLQAAETALAGVTEMSTRVTEITPEMQAALDSALNAKNLDAYNAGMGIFAGLVEDQIGKQKELDDTLKKYGISWTETGEKAKMAKLAEIAGGLSKEFDILKGAGIDVNHIMGKMGPHVNQFVKDAKKAGVEVPQSFKSVIQTAIDSGQVFDDNGKKVTDITTLGLTFGDTMETVQREMVDAMKELARVLREDLGGAFTTVRRTADEELKRIPREIDVKVNYESEGYEPGESSHSGSIIRNWGLEKAHTGGLLSDERLIVAQTGEGILNRRAVANMGAGAVHALNRGEMPRGYDPELRAEVKGLRRDITRLYRQLPEQLRSAQMGPRQR